MPSLSYFHTTEKLEHTLVSSLPPAPPYSEVYFKFPSSAAVIHHDFGTFLLGASSEADVYIEASSAFCMHFPINVSQHFLIGVICFPEQTPLATYGQRVMLVTIICYDKVNGVSHHEQQVELFVKQETDEGFRGQRQHLAASH